MATFPFLLLLYFFASYMESRCKPKKEIKSKPKYRMKEVTAEEDELFLTDAGDFDEAFRL